MGVRGLQRIVSFHERKASIRIDISAGCPQGRRGVVFDGGSLLYHIEQSVLNDSPLHIHSFAGGCLPIFSQVARDFIDRFLDARIPIWVVFDGIQANAKQSKRILRRQGAHSASQIIEKYLQKSQGKIQIVNFALNVNGVRASEMSKATLVQVLREMGVPTSFAVHEADNECVRLCNEVGAMAIVGHDSDYFVFDHIGGYIPLYSLVFDDDGTIYGRLFRAEALAECFGVPLSFLPFIASLVGNDAIVQQSPELFTLHQVLKQRSLSVPVIEQILDSAKSYHRQRPTESALEFLKYFVVNTISNAALAGQLLSRVQAIGVEQYTIPVSINTDSVFLRLHCSGRLSSTFAMDVFMNRTVYVQFGIGYSTRGDIDFVLSALQPLYRRICQVILWHIPPPWSVKLLAFGIDMDDCILASDSDIFPIEFSWLIPGISIVDQCHSNTIGRSDKTRLLQFVIFGFNDKSKWREDSVFMNSIRYLQVNCPGANDIVPYLITMHEALQSGAGTIIDHVVPPIHLFSLRSSAVFRHALMLIDMMNTLIGWPLPEARLQTCFNSTTFHQLLSDSFVKRDGRLSNFFVTRDRRWLPRESCQGPTIHQALSLS